MDGLVCAIDAGTSVIKAALIDPSGRLVRSASRPMPQSPSQSNLFAFDPAACFETTCDILRSLNAPELDGAGQIRAICITSQRATILALDGEGNSLAALSWADDRCGASVSRLSEQFGARAFHQIVGIPLISLLSVGKIRWLAEEHSHIFRRAARFVLVHDDLMHRLGAPDYVTDYSHGTCTGLMNRHTRDWDPDLLECIDIRASMLPRLMPAGSIAGGLCPAVAESIGFPPETPLVVGGGDQEVATLGMGVYDEGTVGISLGTSASVCSLTANPQVDLHKGSICVHHVVDDLWVNEGFQISFASSLQWYEQLHGAFPETGDVPDFERPVFIPFNVNRSGEARDGGTGMLGLLSPQDDPVTLAAGVLDGILLELCHVMEQTLSKTAPSRILVAGGASGVPGLLERLATILGYPIEVSDEREAALLGAACLAWSGIDPNDTPEAVSRQFLQSSTCRRINPQPVPELAELHRRYRHRRETEGRLSVIPRDRNTASAPTPELGPEGPDSLRKRAMGFAGIGMFRYALDGTVLSMDRTTLEILELTDLYPDPEAVRGMNIGDLFHYEAPPGSMRQAVQEKGRVPFQEYRFTTLGGTKKWSLHDSYLEYDEATGEEFLQVMCRDITARKQAHEELQKKETSFRNMIESSHEVVFSKDREGRYHSLNLNTAISLGYTSIEEVEGKTDYDLLPAKEAAALRKIDASVMESGEAIETEEIISDPQGEARIYLSRKWALYDEDDVCGIRCLAIDITERKKLEEQLRQSEKMQAVGELAGGIAHDFNNQLTGMLCFADLLINRAEDPDLKRYAESISKAAKQAAELTCQLLSFGRKGKNLSQPVQIHQVLLDVISILEHSIDKRIKIRRQLNASPATTIGDPNQLQNLFLNIALNARDAMPGGGELIFETDNLQLDDGNCKGHIHPVLPGQYLRVSIEDNGCGMDAETQRHIFEPFFTTKERGKGTGMGLASVYGTIRSHSGTLNLHSQLQHGTTFEIYLPLSEDIQDGQSPSAIRSPVTGTAHILLADDQEIVREAAGEALRCLGYTVTLCNDGRQAVEYYKESWKETDLVILDMVMPELGGRDAFSAMRVINSDVKAILSSGYSINDEVQTILDEGVMAFISKPYKQADLSERVAQILQGED